MKITLLHIVSATLVAFTSPVFADDGSGASDQTNCTESVDASIVLTPTDNAPAGAGGTAHLEVEAEDGTQTANLSLRAFGLNAGIYDVSAITSSDGSNVDIGLITIGNSGDDDGEGEDGGGFWGGGGITWSNGMCWSNTVGFSGNGTESVAKADDGGDNSDCQGTNSTVFTSHDNLPLPAGLDPTDIAQIIVSDTNGTPMLEGNFTNLVAGSTMTFDLTVPITPGEGAPNAQGFVHVQSTVARGKHKNRFELAASGMPASTAFHVHLNGARVGAVKSNTEGSLAVRKTPVNILKLHSVQLIDAHGHEAARAHF